MTAKTMNVPCLLGIWPSQPTATSSAKANTTQMTRHAERSGCSGKSISRCIESKTPAITDGGENAEEAPEVSSAWHRCLPLNGQQALPRRTQPVVDVGPDPADPAGDG